MRSLRTWSQAVIVWPRSRHRTTCQISDVSCQIGDGHRTTPQYYRTIILSQSSYAKSRNVKKVPNLVFHFLAVYIYDCYARLLISVHFTLHTKRPSPSLIVNQLYINNFTRKWAKVGEILEFFLIFFTLAAKHCI